MSLGRLLYYSAVLAGWGAFLAWAATEFTIYGRLPDGMLAIAMAAAVGAAIGCAVNVAAGLGQGNAAALGTRAAFGLGGGAVGGAFGGAIGNFVFQSGLLLGQPWLARAVGWMLMGIGIGIIDGIQERSLSKLRNGLIGGAVGGLIGGLLFDPLVALVGSTTGMSSRATALVVLGVAIGACIGLAQVVLKEAWLTVVDGYRPGRQLILSRPVTVLGRAEQLPLAFIGSMNADLRPEQVRIARQRDGGFMLEDEGGAAVAVNHRPVSGATRLADGDVIKLGANLIRFNERRIRSPGETAAPAKPGASTTPQPPGPTPPKPTPPRPVPPPPPAPGGQSPPQPPRPGTGPTPPAPGGGAVSRPSGPPPKPVTPPSGPAGGVPAAKPAAGSRPAPPPPPPPPKR